MNLYLVVSLIKMYIDKGLVQMTSLSCWNSFICMFAAIEHLTPSRHRHPRSADLNSDSWTSVCSQRGFCSDGEEPPMKSVENCNSLSLRKVKGWAPGPSISSLTAFHSLGRVIVCLVSELFHLPFLLQERSFGRFSVTLRPLPLPGTQRGPCWLTPATTRKESTTITERWVRSSCSASPMTPEVDLRPGTSHLGSTF